MTWWKWTQSERLSMAALGSRDPRNLAAESHDSDVRAILALLERFKFGAVLPSSCMLEIKQPIASGSFVPKYVHRNGLVALDADRKIIPFERGDIPIGIAMSSARKGEIVDVCLSGTVDHKGALRPGVVETEMECRTSKAIEDACQPNTKQGQ